MEKLGIVDALDFLFNAREGGHILQLNDSADENDENNYNDEDDCSSTVNDDYDEDLGTYYLSLDNYQVYVNPSEDIFPVNNSLTRKTVLKFQLLGVI